MKPEFIDLFFEQIEYQVQFGDTKASLLVAGDAILLASSGSLVKMVSGCPGDEFTVSCMIPSVSLVLATVASALLMLSLTLALLAARPAKIHDKPRDELFLLSRIAITDRHKFVRRYLNTSPQLLAKEALRTIHGKAKFATRKFRLLKLATNTTLTSLGFMVATVVWAVGSHVFS